MFESLGVVDILGPPIESQDFFHAYTKITVEYVNYYVSNFRIRLTMTQ